MICMHGSFKPVEAEYDLRYLDISVFSSSIGMSLAFP